MKKLLLQAIIGIILVLGGLFLWQQRLANAEVNAEPGIIAKTMQVSAPTSATLSGHPDHLSIDSLHMSLDIIDGVYNAKTQSWTLTLNKVQYAVITPPPNNASGNTFLYGHYRPEVFARLHTIKVGAQAVVRTDNGHTFTYQLREVKVIEPTDDSLFKYQGTPILTIQTCTGALFQHRQLFIFNLVKAV